MYPSYTSQKVVHDQMIQETLERYHADGGQAPRPGHLRQLMKRVLTRVTTLPREEKTDLARAVSSESYTRLLGPREDASRMAETMPTEHPEQECVAR